MPKSILYSPKRQIRVMEQNQQTIILGEDGKPVSTAMAKTLKAEATGFLTSQLFGMMMEDLRADAVRVGLVEYTKEEHALYAKAVWHVTRMCEGIVKELSELKIDEIAGPSNRV